MLDGIKMGTALSAVALSLTLWGTTTFVQPAYSYSVSSMDSIESIYQKKNYKNLSKKDRNEVDCLAKNIYHEARQESFMGWKAVAAVTMNRLLSGNYADSVCGVVYQKTGATYQFSWVGLRNKLKISERDVYDEILNLATYTYLSYDADKDPTKGSTFYHASRVNPRWKLERVKKIGRHVFYRSKRDTISLDVT